MINANKFTEYEGILPLTLYNPLNTSIGPSGYFTGINDEFEWESVSGTTTNGICSFNTSGGSWGNIFNVRVNKDVFINTIQKNGIFFKFNLIISEQTNLTNIRFFIEHGYTKSSDDTTYYHQSPAIELWDGEENKVACAYLPPSALSDFFKEKNFVNTKFIGIHVRAFGSNFTLSGKFNKAMYLIPNVNLEHYFPYFTSLSSEDKAKIIEKTVPYFYGYKTLGDTINLATPQSLVVTNLTELGDYAYRREEDQVGVNWSRIGCGGISGYNYARLNVLTNTLCLTFSLDANDGYTHFKAGQIGQMECMRFGKSIVSPTDYLNEYGNYLYCSDITFTQNKNAPAGEFSIDYGSYMRVNLSDSGWDFLFKISGFSDEEIYEWCKSFPSKENFPYTPHFNALELAKVGAEKTENDTVYTLGIAKVSLKNINSLPLDNTNNIYGWKVPTWSDSIYSYDESTGILTISNIEVDSSNKGGWINLVERERISEQEFQELKTKGCFVRFKIADLNITTQSENVKFFCFLERAYNNSSGGIGYFQTASKFFSIEDGYQTAYFAPEIFEKTYEDFESWKSSYYYFPVRITKLQEGDTISAQVSEYSIVIPSVNLEEAFPYFASLSDDEKKEILDTLPFFEDEFELCQTLENRCNPDKGIGTTAYYDKPDSIDYDPDTFTITFNYNNDPSITVPQYVFLGQDDLTHWPSDSAVVFYDRCEIDFTSSPAVSETTQLNRIFGNEVWTHLSGNTPNEINVPIKQYENGFHKKSFLGFTSSTNGTPVFSYLKANQLPELDGSSLRLKNIVLINLTYLGWYLYFKLIGASDNEIYQWCENLPVFKDTYTPRITSFLGYNSFRPEGEVYSNELIESEGAEAFGMVQPEYNLPENVGLRMLPLGKMVSNQFVETETATGIQIVREPIEEIPDIEFVNMVPDFTSEGGEVR